MIKTYIVNLPNRVERKSHIIKQYKNKYELDCKIINPTPDNISTISLWMTIQQIIREKIDWTNDFFILCEDDHMFTNDYSFEFFNHAIQEAQELDADILSGGVSWFQTGIQISRNLFWVESFSGLQFTVIFRKFYQKVLDVNDFGEHDAADLKISALTDKKFVMYPFISIQKEFGYSDVTAKNNEGGRVERLFEDTSGRLQLLKNVRQFYLPDFQK